MKTRKWVALLAVVAAGLLMLPLAACLQVVKKEEEPKKTEISKPADASALGR